MLPQLLPMAMLLLPRVLPSLYVVMVPLLQLALLLPMATLLVGAMLLTLLELFMLLREKLKLMLCTGPMDTVVLDMVDTALLDTEVSDTPTVSTLGPMDLAMDILTMDELKNLRNAILLTIIFLHKI